MSLNRGATLAITLLGAITNLALTVQVLVAWRSLKWEPESEWDGAQYNGVKFVWALLFAYFSASSILSFIGLTGTLKNKLGYIRFYRDASIGDFAFCAFSTIIGAYAAFQPFVRTNVCEELSRQPELLRDLAELGLNLENCESWFESAILPTFAVAVVLVVIRLHFLLVVSNYYSHLSRCYKNNILPVHGGRHSFRRIYIVPQTIPADSGDVVYAPIPLSTLEPAAAADLVASATPAWISPARIPQDSCKDSGRIRLPVTPGEGLLERKDSL